VKYDTNIDGDRLCNGSFSLYTVSHKNAPTLASCSFDKRGLILIIFGKQHQRTFINDKHIQLFVHSLILTLLFLKVCWCWCCWQKVI